MLKHYYSYVPIAAKAHKKQNRTVGLCITVAVFSVTAIFSVMEMMVREETSRLIHKHGIESIQSFFGSQAAMSFYPIALLLFLLVLIAGSLMISSTISAEVTRKTEMYGVMRCIGMSKIQVRRLVRLDALNRCKIAVPLGIINGTVVEWAFCAILKYLIGGEFSTMPQMGISIIGIASGILIGFLTVLLAAQKPAKIAAGIAPSVAAAGGAENHKTVSRTLIHKYFPIAIGIGIKHAVSDRRRLTLLTCSFALAIVLFFSFSVLIQLVNCLLPQSATAADIEISSIDLGNRIDAAYLEELKTIPGVAQVYGRRSCFDLNYHSWVNKATTTADIISFSDYELEGLKKDHYLKPGASLTDVLGQGNGVLIIADAEYNCGNKVMINGKTFSVGGQLKLDPFSADGCPHGKTTLILSDENFTKLTNITDYAIISLQLSENATKQTVSEIKALIGNAGKVEELETAAKHSTYLAFVTCVYLFSALIGLVAVLNIINSISFGVAVKLKEYRTMQALGMEKKQMLTMLITESAVFVLCGLISGLTLGLPLSYLLYKYLVTEHFPYSLWQLPIIQILIILCFMLIALLLGVIKPIKQLQNLSVTEITREL